MGNLRPALDSDWDAWPGLRDFLPEPRDPQGWPTEGETAPQTTCDHPCEAYFVDGSCACTSGQSRFTDEELSDDDA